MASFVWSVILSYPLHGPTDVAEKANHSIGEVEQGIYMKAFQVIQAGFEPKTLQYKSTGRLRVSLTVDPVQRLRST